MSQAEKAEIFRMQHQDEKLLLLPNIWDVLSARLLASAGFQSVATASISVAAVNGYHDGEQIPLARLLDIISNITHAVNLPVSVDFEQGYANDNNTLSDNIKRLLDAGAVGLNIEDSRDHKMASIAEQCKKIEVIRNTALRYGVPLFINARTDIYLLKTNGDLLNETIQRANAYQAAGADCFYPILLSNMSDLQNLIEEIQLPVNVLLNKQLADLKQLESIGVKRVSLGPGTLKFILTQLQNMVGDLQQYSTSRFFAEELITNDDLKFLIA